jgi:hypothetical protein
MARSTGKHSWNTSPPKRRDNTYRAVSRFKLADVVKTYEQVTGIELSEDRRAEMTAQPQIAALARFGAPRRLQAAMRAKRIDGRLDLARWLSIARELRNERRYTPLDTLRPPERTEVNPSSGAARPDTRALSDGDLHRRIRQMRDEGGSADW